MKGDKLDSGDSEPSAPVLYTDVSNTSYQQHIESNLVRSHSSETNLLRDLIQKSKGDIEKVAEWAIALGITLTYEEIKDEINKSNMLHKYGDDIDTAASQLGAPDIFFCPISFHLLRDPVVLPETGQTYERSAIERWFQEGHASCPITGIALVQPVNITPNVALRKAIEEWAEINANWLLGRDGKILSVSNPIARDFSLKTDMPGSSIPSQVSIDKDMAIAITLQQKEMQNIPSRTTYRILPQHTVSDMIYNELQEREGNRAYKCKRLLSLFTVVYCSFFLFTLYKSEMEFEKKINNPLYGFSRRIISTYGGTNERAIVERYQWWRLITSMFMTSGVLHLIWVVFGLGIFGSYISKSMSYISLGFLFITSGICGVLFSANLSSSYVTTGGSGAVFGLMGASLMEFVFNRERHTRNIIILFEFVLFTFFAVVIGLTPFVDNWCNIGGFVCGIFISTSLMLTHKGTKRDGKYFKQAAYTFYQVVMVAAAVILILLAAANLQFRSGTLNSCKWCKDINCVEISSLKWNCNAAKLFPNKCNFDIMGNLTTIITCPKGDSQTLQLQSVSEISLDQYCKQMCMKDEDFQSDSSSSDEGFSNDISLGVEDDLNTGQSTVTIESVPTFGNGTSASALVLNTNTE